MFFEHVCQKFSLKVLLSFTYFFVNFSLALLIKVLLIKKRKVVYCYLERNDAEVLKFCLDILSFNEISNPFYKSRPPIKPHLKVSKLDRRRGRFLEEILKFALIRRKGNQYKGNIECLLLVNN